jgi:large subunit ribosomal protein L16
MKKRTMKRHKGRTSEVPAQGRKLTGAYSLVSEEPGRVTAKQIASLIMTLKRKIPTGTTIIPRVFATYPVTAKPLEVRMGKGKGSIDHKIARVRRNTVIIELDKKIAGVDYATMLRQAGMKLPVNTRIEQGK